MLYVFILEICRELWFYSVIGASLALGLRFCGTGNTDAKNLLLEIFSDCLAVEENKNAMLYVKGELLKECFAIIGLSLALVMSGSCDELSTKVISKTSHYFLNSGPINYKLEFISSISLGLLYMATGK